MTSFHAIGLLLGKAEVDFIIQSDSDIIPVEVKAQTRLGGKSLSVYDATYHPVCKLRYSLNNLKQDRTLINIPLYLADWTRKIISSSHNHLLIIP